MFWLELLKAWKTVTAIKKVENDASLDEAVEMIPNNFLSILKCDAGVIDGLLDSNLIAEYFLLASPASVNTWRIFDSEVRVVR
jgi:hypothetical protein